MERISYWCEYLGKEDMLHINPRPFAESLMDWDLV